MSQQLDIDEDVVHACNRLGVQLFEALCAQNAGHTTVFSPLSAFVATSMAVAGWDEVDQRDWWESLGCEDAIDTDLSDVCRRLVSNQMTIANGMWVDPAFTIDPALARCFRDTYQTGVTRAALADACPHINAWISEQTQDMIPQLLSSLGPDVVAVIVNALWFHGTWQRPFSPIEPMPFAIGGGETPVVRMMQRSGTFDYTWTEQYQMVALPYTAGCSLKVYLPHVIGVCPDIPDVDLLPPVRCRGSVRMPPFRSRMRCDLDQPLEQIGRGSFFKTWVTGLRDPSGIPALYSQVVQESVLDVDELGTTMASATAVLAVSGCAGFDPVVPFEMTVDHPFLVSLEHDETGVILLLGWIADPR